LDVLDGEVFCEQKGPVPVSHQAAPDAAGRPSRGLAAKLKAVARPARLLTALASEAELARLVVQSVYELTGGYSANLFLVRDGGLTLAAGVGDFQGGPPLGRRLKLGQGITGTAASRGESIAVSDTLTDSLFVAEASLPRTRAELAVPVQHHGQLLGVIDIQHAEPHVYDPGDIEALETLAGQFAVALENARLYDLQLALYGISDAAQRAASPEALCAAIHSIIARLMDAPNFSIALAEGDLIRFPYADGELDVPPPRRQRRRGLTEYVMRTGVAQLVSEARLQELIAAGEVEARPRQLTAWLGVPLATGGEPFGVLAVQTPREGGCYGEREREILTFVSHEVALAIETQRAHETLRQSETLYRTLVDNMLDGVFLLRNERVVFANEAFARLFSLGVKDVIGRPFLDFIAPEHREWVLARYHRRQAGGAEPRDYELRALHSDGVTRIDAIVSVAVVQYQGQTATLGTLHDLSERRRAEAERSRMRGQLQNIIDSMPSAVVGVDPEGVVTEWNVQAEQMTGTKAAEALGRPLAELIPWLGPQMESVRAALASGAVRKERLVQPGRGAPRYLELVVYPLAREHGGAVIRIDDVSERVRMDRLLTQTEKMMAVGGIAAGVAHEINNPLGGIMHGAQNVLRRLSPELPRNQELALECGTDLGAVRAYAERRQILEMLEGIRAAGRRASGIVSDMLRFARPSELRSTPADLAELADRMIALASTDFDLKKRYDFRRFEIVRDYTADLPPIPCLATDVELVILNLIKNAAQALHARPPASPWIRVATRLEPPWAVLEVSDNGPGMDEATRQCVFEPFFSTKGESGGTGLGLSVSRFIVVDLHGGEMSVASSPGAGARFSVRLPIAGRTAETGAATQRGRA
jgi:PAS domain S-box-containing protein